MSEERLAAAQRRLDDIAQQTLEGQAEALDVVHAALLTELDDLLERTADGRTAGS